MSVRNKKGTFSLILNGSGYWDVYDSKGNKLDLLFSKIHVVQSASDSDAFLLRGSCNVFRTVEEMNEFINSK